MQFAVPQFTDVEDKLIGPLTLKQFLSLLATGGVIMFFWSLLGFSIFFFFFAIPVALIGLGLTFGKFNTRPMYIYVVPLFNLFVKPQARVFKREEPTVVIKMEKKVEATPAKNLEEPAESRLKKLAYLLDQKAHEEEELIGQGTDIK
jgi:hypothetical protein